MPKASPARATTSQPPFEMKAGQFTIPTLVLRDRDADALDAFLAEQVMRSPRFFDRAPVALDISQLSSEGAIDLLILFVGVLRGHGMIPVGVRGASPEQHDSIAALELSLMPAPRRPANPVAAAPAVRTARPSLVIEQAVRSGQRIFARDGDLVLLGGVSSGAEVLAEGHIHAYGALRGRVMAGVAGDTSARIFCRELGAELISIAGRYRVSENLDSRYVGTAVQISLSGDSLEFQLL